jgi:hypothetical protein
MISKLKQVSDIFIGIDQKLGLVKFIKYLIILAIAILMIPFLKDPRGTLKETVEFFLDLQAEIEADRFRSRDYVMKELNPLLRELRAATGCDRVVYYEYHNSIENEAGIPFRFVDLVQQAPRMGISPVKPLDNVNVSRFAELYLEMTEIGYVVNNGSSEFSNRFPGYTEISNGSSMQVFCDIPGINLPLGLVVLEWTDKDESVDWANITYISRRECLRINALMSQAKKEFLEK